jgi:formate/nitrite transporter FocA (FNT family)
MSTASDYGRRKDRSLLAGAIAFLGVVFYVNIRHDHIVTPIDWAVITFAVIFAIALFKRYRDDK